MLILLQAPYAFEDCIKFPKDKALPTNSAALQSLWKAECLLSAEDFGVFGYSRVSSALVIF